MSSGLTLLMLSRAPGGAQEVPSTITSFSEGQEGAEGIPFCLCENTAAGTNKVLGSLDIPLP